LASDVIIAPKAQDFIDALPPHLRSEWEDLLERFLDDPFPTDGRSREQPFPYPPGTYGHASGSFWLTFRLENPEVLWIGYVDYLPPESTYRRFTR
jgi:hypothetical protein